MSDCCFEACQSQRLPEPQDDTFLAVRDLSVRYGAKVALESVDIDIQRGRVTALIGPSGCGKTSFLFTLNRLSDLIPGCGVGGRVRFEGTEIYADGVDIGLLRANIGMVFQKPNLFPVSIRKNLYLPLREHGCPVNQLDRRSEEVLREVGLWSEVSDRLDASAHSLSGGQQQRLCIARALTLRPKLLLMDEPCSSLDPMATDVIERLILKMRGEYSIVIVTHNLAQAQRIADDVAVFWCHDESGCVIESGHAEAVFRAPKQPDTVAYLAGQRG
jgi:phosphate transport system ATP-binding protein